MSANINENEIIEINFFEPALGLIISNLEFLETELKEEKITNPDLTNLINEISEIDEFEQWEACVKKLNILIPQLLNIIEKIINANRYELLAILFTIIALTNNLAEQGQFMTKVIALQNEVNQSEEQLIQEMKKYIVILAQQIYQELSIRDDSEFIKSDEWQKVIDTLNKDQELTFDDVKDGSSLLIELFELDNKLNHQNFFHLSNIFKNLIEIDALITLIEFWEQGLLDEEE